MACRAVHHRSAPSYILVQLASSIVLAQSGRSRKRSCLYLVVLCRFLVTANLPEDVVAAVQFAADYNLKVSALGGGHQLAGVALPNCGVTILMYKLQNLALDPVTNMTTVQASHAVG